MDTTIYVPRKNKIITGVIFMLIALAFGLGIYSYGNLSGLINTTNAQISETIETANGVSGAVDSLTESVSEQNDHIIEIDNGQTQIKTDLDLTQDQLDTIRNAVNGLNQNVISLDGLINNNSNIIGNIEEDLIDVYSQIDDINTQLLNLTDYDSLVNSVAQLTNTIGELTIQVTELYSNLEVTSDRLSALENPLEVTNWSDAYIDSEIGEVYYYITIKNNAYYDISNISQFFNVVLYLNDETNTKIVCVIDSGGIFAGGTQVFVCRTILSTEIDTYTPLNFMMEKKQE